MESRIGFLPCWSWALMTVNGPGHQFIQSSPSTLSHPPSLHTYSTSLWQFLVLALEYRGDQGFSVKGKVAI